MKIIKMTRKREIENKLILLLLLMLLYCSTTISSNGIADIQAEAAVATNPIRPMSAFHVRNRLLSRMGAQVTID